jgi:hypothetical protein
MIANKNKKHGFADASEGRSTIQIYLAIHITFISLSHST